MATNARGQDNGPAKAHFTAPTFQLMLGLSLCHSMKATSTTVQQRGSPRPGSRQHFFLTPASAKQKQRQYEALRAYFVEGRATREVARDFAYSTGSFQVLCHHFRRETDPVFFVSPRPGPRDQITLLTIRTPIFTAGSKATN
jgi:hypothetical protein